MFWACLRECIICCEQVAETPNNNLTISDVWHIILTAWGSFISRLMVSVSPWEKKHVSVWDNRHFSLPGRHVDHVAVLKTHPSSLKSRSKRTVREFTWSLLTISWPTWQNSLIPSSWSGIIPGTYAIPNQAVTGDISLLRYSLVLTIFIHIYIYTGWWLKNRLKKWWSESPWEGWQPIHYGK